MFPQVADAAFGASILAGVGIGVLGKLEEAMRLCISRDFVIRYNRGNHEIYNELFNKFKRMKAVCDEYKK